jgi:transglycosylase-like protein with SLT domain
MNPLILIALAAGGIFAMKAMGGGASDGSGTSTVNFAVDTNSQVTRSNPWNLPDIDSANQAGGFDTTYDQSYEKASGSTGVPFALIKAHAIRESSQNPTATHADTATNSSYGLLQVEWSTDTSSSLYNRLQKYGVIQFSGSALSPTVLEDPDTSAFLGASIIADNLNWLTPGGKNGLQGLRDTINAYNTGTTEAKIEAPANYVNDVMNYYQQILGEQIS